jgi:hypothetical protein
VLFVLVAVSPGFTQDDGGPTLQQLVAEHTYRIALDRGRLDGPGAALLRDRLAGTYFFLVGEQHATADLAHLEMALWNEAHDRGYEYHAVEIGPIGTEKLEELLRNGGPEALRAFQLEGDNLLTFPFVFFEEEARLVQAVVQDSRDDVRALWGLDQEFIAGGRVVLERLAALAETEAQRAAVAAAQEQAASDLMWLGMAPPESFTPLQEAFADHPVGHRILEDAVLSNAIYAPFTGRGGSVYSANDKRERFMKQNFLQYYREVQERTGVTPRVFLKFGANHLAAGHSPTHVVTLGTFLVDLALVEGLETFSLHLDCQGGLVRDPRSGETQECSSYFLGEDSDLAALLPDEHMAILDLRSLRPYMQRFKDWDERSRALLLAYDAVLFVQDVGPATLPSR